MNNDALDRDDDYCLNKIAGGDEHCFNIIFNRYRNQLFTYLFKVTKSKEIAEEIVLDVFLKLWQGREVVAEIENLDRFLLKVAHNKAIDFFRAARRNPKVQEEVWDLINAIQAYETADKRLMEKDFDDMVWAAVKQLSPQRQKVFQLNKNKDLTYNDIAKELNLTTHTVRNHLAASIKFIRQYILKNDVLPILLAACITKNF